MTTHHQEGLANTSEQVAESCDADAEFPGAIVGIVAGVVAAVGLCIGCTILVRRRNQAKMQRPQHPHQPPTYAQPPPMQYGQQPPMQYGQQPPMQYGQQPPMQYGQQPPQQPPVYANAPAPPGQVSRF